jgi:hypothetical protein
MNQTVKISLIVVGSLLGLLLFLAALGFAYFYSAQQQDITAHDQQLLVTPVELEPYFIDFKANNSEIAYQKVKYIDGAIELSMEYDVVEEDHPYVSVVITRSRKKADALSNFYLAWSAQNAFFNAYDSAFEIVEDNEFFNLGDKSRFAFINYESNPVGNRLVFLQGKTVYEFTMTGFYIDQQQIWEDLFAGKLSQLKKFH